ncbi:MAG: RNA 2',3'-cyclic phosphodiesterase [Verrucomicrobiota bacterium]|jgi:2'-5' RNA ligase
MADDISAKSLRLFVAISLPDHVRHAITAAQEELRALVSPNAIRWTNPDQFHLTLKFLGDVPAGQEGALRAALQPICAAAYALFLCAQGVGFFPHERSPRVIWAGINESTGSLADLQKRIEAAVQPFAPRQGTEKFSGHVTLGRVKFLKRPEAGKLAGYARSLNQRQFGEWTAKEVELIQSELAPSGARHSVLAAFPLGHRR